MEGGEGGRGRGGGGREVKEGTRRLPLLLFQLSSRVIEWKLNIMQALSEATTVMKVCHTRAPEY